VRWSKKIYIFYIKILKYIFRDSVSNLTGVMESQPVYHRARVFMLTADNEWRDVATGLCTVDPPSTDTPTDTLTLSIHSDPPTPSHLLHQLTLTRTTPVSVQQETVVSWTRPGDGVDVAVSFETQTGCEEVWAAVCRFQGRDGGCGGGEGDGDNELAAPLVLPQVVDRTTVHDISSVLEQAGQSPTYRHSLTAYLHSARYITRLIDVYHECSSSSSSGSGDCTTANSEVQVALFSIFKNLFLLNSAVLIKEMMGEAVVYDVAGIFEHEPGGGCSTTSSSAAGTSTAGAPSYRDYLQHSARFRQIVPVHSAHLLSLIHETFRLQYFKDVILSRHLDDDTFTTMVVLIRSNQMDIVGGLEEEGAMYEELAKGGYQYCDQPTN
jgi:protein phosphatase-4 regulatory subunit 3